MLLICQDLLLWNVEELRENLVQMNACFVVVNAYRLIWRIWKIFAVIVGPLFTSQLFICTCNRLLSQWLFYVTSGW